MIRIVRLEELPRTSFGRVLILTARVPDRRANRGDPERTFEVHPERRMAWELRADRAGGPKSWRTLREGYLKEELIAATLNRYEREREREMREEIEAESWRQLKEEEAEQRLNEELGPLKF